MIDFLRARAIAETYISNELAVDAECRPLVIVRISPHRCGWEFEAQGLPWLESGGAPDHLVIGLGPFVVDRRDGSVEQHGSGDADSSMLTQHRRYDAETGQRPSYGHECGC